MADAARHFIADQINRATGGDVPLYHLEPPMTEVHDNTLEAAFAIVSEALDVSCYFAANLAVSTTQDRITKCT